MASSKATIFLRGMIMPMKILGEGSLCRLMERLCGLLMIAGGLFLTGLPWILRFYFHLKGHAGTVLYVTMLVVLYVSGICGMLILWQGKQILCNINASDPFTSDTAQRMRRIALLCLPVAIVYLLATILMPSMLVVLVGIVFLFLAALSAIMTEVFLQAVRFKQENDLTI